MARAKLEVSGINPTWARRYGWDPEMRAGKDWIDLLISFTRREAGSDGRPVRYRLRLRYTEDFATAGRREAFVNPSDPDDTGSEHWPQGVAGILPSNNPPAICLEGTHGFHSHLHRDRDPSASNLNKLLMEIQRMMDR